MYTKFVGCRWLCATTIALLALAGWSKAVLAEDNKPEPPKPKDIVDVARQTDTLKTFCTLLEKAGLVDTLKEKGTYTVFAPTDEAFNKLGKDTLADLQKPENKAKLQRILRNHLVAERRAAADLEKAKVVRTMAGGHLKITVKDGVVMIENAKVTQGNMEACNGLIHQVDTVLMPLEE